MNNEYLYIILILVFYLYQIYLFYIHVMYRYMYKCIFLQKKRGMVIKAKKEKKIFVHKCMLSYNPIWNTNRIIWNETLHWLAC